MAKSRSVRREGARPKERAAQRMEQAVEAMTLAGKMQAGSFVEFIRERGVVGLAVGVILGSSVTAAAHSFVDNVIDPVLALLIGSENRLDQATIHLSTAEIRIGHFISALIDVLLLILLLYIVFRLLRLDKLDKKQPRVRDD